jgi:predicted protein tyrosine phosphatase
MIRVLFICGKARARSPTAAQLFADWDGVQTDFGGISRDADDALSTDQIDWADLILAMERRHLTRLSDRFGRQLNGKRMIALGIADRYRFMQPELIQELRAKAAPHLR